MKPRYERLWAVKVSEDHGKSWKLVAICETCFAGLNEPMRGKKDGHAFTRRCDWCGCPHLDTKPPDVEMGDSTKSLMAALDLMLDEELGTEEPLPVDDVMLDIAFSPVIPIRNGDIDRDTVEVEKLSEFTYRYWFRGRMRDVGAEELREMRARYLVANGKRQSAFLMGNNKPGSLLHELGKRGAVRIRLDESETNQ